MLGAWACSAVPASWSRRSAPSVRLQGKDPQGKDIDTIATGRRLGHPVRCLKNPFTRDLFKQEYNPNISDEELEKMGAGALRKAAKEGDEKNGSFMAGQCAAMVHKEQPAKEMIEEMFAEAEQILRGASQFCK